MFATEADCVAFLVHMRWSGAYICPSCGHGEWWLTSRMYVCCSKCRRQHSLKAGTLLQGTRLPLKTWFQIGWYFCEQKNGISALGLQRSMGFGGYHTAWEWLHRMRQAMTQSGRDKLSGTVEVDEAFIGGVKPGVRGRGALGKAKIFVAAEDRGSAIGRIRLMVIPNTTAATLLTAVDTLIDKRSHVVTDGNSAYLPLSVCGYGHTVATPATHGKNVVPKAHRVIALLKRWLLGTHQGAVNHDRLQSYLDEFVFRFNRRSSGSRGLLFFRLMEQVVKTSPITRDNL